VLVSRRLGKRKRRELAERQAAQIRPRGKSEFSLPVRDVVVTVDGRKINLGAGLMIYKPS
jgi:hypothetical protein